MNLVYSSLCVQTYLQKLGFLGSAFVG